MIVSELASSRVSELAGRTDAELASSRVSELAGRTDAELASSRVGECAELAGSQVGESAGRGETDTPDCSWLRSEKVMNRPCAGLKEREGKKRKFPFTPLREKGKGKKTDGMY